MALKQWIKPTHVVYICEYISGCVSVSVILTYIDV